MKMPNQTLKATLLDFGPEGGEAIRRAWPILCRIPVDAFSEAERQILARTAQFYDLGATQKKCDSNDVPDPWTDHLASLRPAKSKRLLGQFFTPWPIVRTMIDWISEQKPAQIVDAGCGTGRFALAAAQALPEATVFAVDSDPVATLLCRAHAKRLELPNLTVFCGDYLRETLPLAKGRTAFTGNPPYVRHHQIAAETKTWAAARCAELGVPHSGLAGLHAYFFLATALRARQGDFGCFITSAEWVDVNYGKLIRNLLLEHLGVLSVSMLDAKATAAFDDAMTSAAITCFEVGRHVQKVRVSHVLRFESATGPDDATIADRTELTGTWGKAITGRTVSQGVRLNAITRVHRGIATGANKFFVMTWEEARHRGLTPFARSVISAGRQILDSGGVVKDTLPRCIICLPRDFEGVSDCARAAARRFLDGGEQQRIHLHYLCAHRTPWWWLGTARPPPIVASYMARRPPAFALNPYGALILNVAHGLFPRITYSPSRLRALVELLNGASEQFVGGGRCYQGGLEKFEPREMEQLILPNSPVLDDLLSLIVSDSQEANRHDLAATA